jgi:primosomal protein N'
MQNEKKKYVSVVFPLALPKILIYEVGEELMDRIQFGIQVEVPLRNKLYSAVVVGI